MMFWVQSLASLSGLGIWCCVSRGVGQRRGSGPALLWLWCGPVATALIRPLAGEPPHAAAAAQEMAKRQKRKEKKTLL